MTGTTHARRPRTATVLGTLVVAYAATFLLGALLHLGVAVPVGFGVLSEPIILPATIVEALCGLGLAVSGYALLTDRPWAWQATVAAHGFALAGVLLGVAAQAAGGGGTALNTGYHLTMLVLLGAGLVVLSSRTARAALGAAGGSG